MKLIIKKYFFIVFVFFVFLIKALVQLDPDFGWHVRLGEIISQNGIPSFDPFSYTMASYPFVDHEWFTNLLLFYLHNALGQLGLAILFTALLLMITLIVFRNNFFTNSFTLALLFLFLATLLPYFGIRPQVQSWLFLSILLCLLEEKIYKKFYWVIPLLSLWWANVHGSFAILIAVLLIDFSVKSYLKKRVLVKRLLVLFISLLATFITPYFYRSWWEVYMQVTDSALRWRIQEWRPSFMFFSLPFIFYLAIYLMALKTSWRELPKEIIIISLFFFIQAISSTRHVPLWAITATPIIFFSFKAFRKQVFKVKFGKQRLDLAGRVFLAISILIFVAQTALSLLSARSTSESVFYPQKAVEFMQDNGFEGRAFSLYAWGGYLLWKEPDKKVYIDGRMPSWRYNNAPVGETNNAMEDYLNILKGDKDFNEEADKYNIEYVLLPRENNSKGIIEKLSMLIKPKKDEDFSIYEYLLNNGWDIVYGDEVSVIYQRKLKPGL